MVKASAAIDYGIGLSVFGIITSIGVFLTIGVDIRHINSGIFLRFVFGWILIFIGVGGAAYKILLDVRQQAESEPHGNLEEG